MDMVARSLMSRSRLASKVSGSQGPEHFLQLLQVLDRVTALPQRGLPLFLGDVLVARQAPPVRLDKLSSSAGR